MVNMSLSLHQDPDDHPRIDANHLMITPIICCGTEGVEFNKPAILTLPHSVPSFRGVDFKCSNGKDIHLWFKSSKDHEWQKLPSKIPEGKNQPFWLKEITYDAVKLELQHFCKFGLSASLPQKMKILLFMHPSKILTTTQTVYVYAYAVQESLSVVIRSKEKKVQTNMCAREDTLTIKPNEKKLVITLKEIMPKPGWKPQTAVKDIPYIKLKDGDEGSRCQFSFSKCCETNPAKIKGQYDAQQEENEYDIKDSFFDIDLDFDTNDIQQGPAITAPREYAIGSLELVPHTANPQRKVSFNPEDFVIRSLGPDDLSNLYLELGLDQVNIDKAIVFANTCDTNLRAKRVFQLWHKTKGQEASVDALLHALKRCRCNETAQILTDLLGSGDVPQAQTAVTGYRSIQQTSSHVVGSSLVPQSKPVNILQLIPMKDTIEEKMQQLEQWRQLLHKTEVRNMLLNILTQHMLDYFSGLHTDDKQHIRNAYVSKTQLDAAEVFLTKISRLGNDEWHRELIEALANSGSTGCCEYLGKLYQRCFVDRKATKRKVQSDHLSIWSEVVQKKISNLCTNLNPDDCLKVLEGHIPEFVTQNQIEFQAARKDRGDNQAFRWFFDKLSKCGDPVWPRALEMAIEGNPIQDAIHESFWDIHSRKKYSSCPCEGEKKSEGTQASLEGESSSST